MLKAILFVGMGGFIGSVGRYMISHWLLKFNHQFPTGTLLVNLTGSFLIGLIIASSLKQSELWRLLLVTGFCGGFTTFSAFSLENLRMLQEGQVLSAIQYIVTSLIGGLFLAFLGYALGTKLLT
jgi:CrcB protein